jgi:hypothetical protein
LADVGATGPTITAVTNAVAVVASRLRAAGIDVEATDASGIQADADAVAALDQPDGSRS